MRGMFIDSITEPFFLSVMFSSLGLFKQVDCPEGPHCSIPSCIFAHREATNHDEGSLPPPRVERSATHSIDLEGGDEPRKRRRVTSSDEHRAITASNTSKVTTQSTASQLPFKRSSSSEKDVRIHKQPKDVLPASITRPISPPPTRSFKGHTTGVKPATGIAGLGNKTAVSKAANSLTKKHKDIPVESLNPRMLANPPAPHNIRVRLVTMMHEQMSRLNDDIKNGDDPSTVGLELSAQELIWTALNEEERTAKGSPIIYANVIKNRIGVLKKMKLPAWKEERLKVIEKDLGEPAPTILQVPKTIDTGLSPMEEITLLPDLLGKQDGLAKYGFVTAQLSSADIEKARQGVEAAQNWEQCDRCRTRFQVFPGRRAEDGALTTGGACRYHPAKPRRPSAQSNADRSYKESVYGCCDESVGASVGCTTAETHVFKVSDPKRLALVMAFENTPENPSLVDKKTAVCFDCEMGYTTQGMELIRLTATSWPSGAILLDTLVRPLGEILDLNSRFSGVWLSDFTSAALNSSPDRPQTLDEEKSPTPALGFAASPAVARSQLFDLIAPTTPLIGHALENDLNAMRIIHPSIIDSCILYPHPRGLPVRHGLKLLMKKHLDRDVQQDGGRGHDSAEDARSAGDLVRLKVGEIWKGMKRDGWKFVAGTAVKPPKESLVENGGRSLG